MPERLERELLRSVPMFFGLKTRQMREFLEVCTLKGLGAGEVLCSYGEPSRKCWVLLEGQLDILGRAGSSVACLHPVQTVGELGLIARRPRTATVRALSAARLLEITFGRLDALLDTDVHLRTCLYRNFIRILGVRLSDANDMTARYKRLYEEATGTTRTCLEPVPATPSDADAGQAGDPDAPAASPRADPPAPATSAPQTNPEVHVSVFFEMQRRLPGPEDMEEGRQVIAQLRESGYSDADIEYAVKWTARHIPSARRFGMVRMSIQEALEDKWSI